MLAGNETSSTALTWLLYRLALHKDVQDRLRAECQAVPNDRPSMDEVNALPFLDQCVHESLRFDNPVANTIREAVTDQVIPLSEPVMGRDGKMMSEVHVKKGTTIFLRGCFAQTPLIPSHYECQPQQGDLGRGRRQVQPRPFRCRRHPPQARPGRVWQPPHIPRRRAQLHVSPRRGSNHALGAGAPEP